MSNEILTGSSEENQNELEAENLTKEKVQSQEESRCLKMDQASIESENSEESSSETCTILQQQDQQNKEESQYQSATTSASSVDDQILSIEKLSKLEVKSKKDDGCHDEDCSIEIDLSEDKLEKKAREVDQYVVLNNHNQNIYHSQSTQDIHSLHSNQMFAPYRNEEPSNMRVYQQSQEQFRGFSEVQPKLSFASQRMKEYFESFKSHRGETLRLYQFFKSTRTELVACLLFTLISSQALIICRTHLFAHSSFKSELLLAYSTNINNNNNQRILEDANYNLAKLGQVSRDGIASPSDGVVHLASGLMASFTVATLTQVFGHISGCHLIPSVSMALYIKGHISRVRLASYFAAQFTGSLLGVSLLNLLTSSQLTVDEYRQILEAARYSSAANDPVSVADASAASSVLRRKKRQLQDDIKTDINLNAIEGSETILLSIAEQQQQQQVKLKQQYQQQQQLDRRILDERTITLNASTYPMLQVHIQPSNDSAGLQHLKQISHELAPNERSVKERETSAAFHSLNDRSRLTFKSAPNAMDPNQPVANGSQKDSIRAEMVQEARPSQPKVPSRRLRVKRRKQQPHQPQQQQPINLTEAKLQNLADSKYYMNLLKFALPDAIMSSESIRQCIDKQQGKSSESKEFVVLRLARKSFSQCLSLSNSSQMFVFQLLATLLIVLTYLVNVDPRRIDLGFKSLSIGLAYFVACAVTIQSGSFFGNPFQLLFLTWLSSSGEWQSEWFIYLLTPFIGGLLGAISHEYIDFTSARNRSKQLHLRRSFYSLDNLQPPVGQSCSLDPQVSIQINALNADDLRCTQNRRVSSSSSLESAASGLTTTSSQQRHQHPRSRKLASYSRQLRIEQRQQLEATNKRLMNPRLNQRASCARRSDFDSNFLISSSQTHNGNGSQRQTSAGGLM